MAPERGGCEASGGCRARGGSGRRLGARRVALVPAQTAVRHIHDTCIELCRFGGSKHRASAPCETVLERLKYTDSERETVCDPTQRFAR